MNTKIPLLAILFLSGIISAFGQQNDEINYLFDPEEQSISGFGSYSNEFSAIDGDFAYSSGGAGALLFNQSFFIGGYGCGLAYRKKFDAVSVKYPYSGNLTTYDDLRMEFNHGGLWLGYIHNYKDRIHFGGSFKIGGGSVSLYENNFWEDDYSRFMKDGVLVLTPQMEVEVNLLKWFKANIGLGYRYVTLTDQTYLTEIGGVEKSVQYFENKDLSSPEVSISLLFGGFGKDIFRFKQKK